MRDSSFPSLGTSGPCCLLVCRLCVGETCGICLAAITNYRYLARRAGRSVYKITEDMQNHVAGG